MYTSFGARKNAAFFGDPDLQAATVSSLVTLAGDLGVDGINVDVEGMDLSFVPSYAGFVRQLREALVAAAPTSQVSVATTAGNGGAAMARVAVDAGAARVFVMGYDYHSAGSEPGASAPLDRADGGERDLRWTLDRYYGAGVPVERTILGLPLYGVSWPVSGPELGADRVGRGAVWVPRRNLEALVDPSRTPVVDPVEVVEFVATRTAEPGVWRAVYYDSPADPDAEAPARERPRAGGRRVLGDRVRARTARLHRIDDAVRQGRATVRAARAPFVRDS